jgi:hypothetical protein
MFSEFINVCVGTSQSHVATQEFIDRALVPIYLTAYQAQVRIAGGRAESQIRFSEPRGMLAGGSCATRATREIDSKRAALSHSAHHALYVDSLALSLAARAALILIRLTHLCSSFPSAPTLPVCIRRARS